MEDFICDDCGYVDVEAKLAAEAEKEDTNTGSAGESSLIPGIIALAISFIGVFVSVLHALGMI